MLDLRIARQLDIDHPSDRRLFQLPQDVVYLDGNSLGAMPTAARERARVVVEEEWANGLIRSWNDAGWVDLARRVGDQIASLVGAQPGTIVACDSTSVNLYKAANSAIADSVGPPVLLTDSGNFPSDLYILGTVAKRHGWTLRIVEPEEVADSIGTGVGVLAVTQVDYRTGRRHDMASVNELARRSEVVTLWDLAHSAGAFAVDLESSGVDYAVGCGYKYLNGGPGAPAFIYVAPHRQEHMGNPITGWFGHATPFDFDMSFVPAEGIDRMRVGTSHVLSLSVMEAALGVFEQVDMRVVWGRGERLVNYLSDGFEEMGLDVITPREPLQRGSQVAFRHPQAYAIVQGLIEVGVIGDFRAPDVARFGIAPLYVEHNDVAITLSQLSDLLSNQDLDRFSTRRGAVT